MKRVFDLLWLLSMPCFCAAQSVAPILRVPVVVHVVYHTEEQNISSAQIYSQFRSLNADFRLDAANGRLGRIVPAFRLLAADTGIEFYLTAIDPEGQPTTGITRTRTGTSVFAGSQIHRTASGGKDGWDPARFLNVWVAPLAPGISGWAAMPGGPPDEDGVVIDFRRFGTFGTVASPFHLGRTLTHELGHWLGLLHPWGVQPGCNGPGDGIDDTPPQEGPSSGCQLGRESCGVLNMVQNFMDFSVDSCLLFFTAGQATFMRTVLTGQRPGNIRNDGLLLTGSQEAAFSASQDLYLYEERGRWQIESRGGAILSGYLVHDLTGRLLVHQKQLQLPAGVGVSLPGIPSVPGCYVVSAFAAGGLSGAYPVRWRVVMR